MFLDCSLQFKNVYEQPKGNFIWLDTWLEAGYLTWDIWGFQELLSVVQCASPQWKRQKGAYSCTLPLGPRVARKSPGGVSQSPLSWDALIGSSADPVGLNPRTSAGDSSLPLLPEAMSGNSSSCHWDSEVRGRATDIHANRRESLLNTCSAPHPSPWSRTAWPPHVNCATARNLPLCPSPPLSFPKWASLSKMSFPLGDCFFFYLTWD